MHIDKNVVLDKLTYSYKRNDLFSNELIYILFLSMKEKQAECKYFPLPGKIKLSNQLYYTAMFSELLFLAPLNISLHCALGRLKQTVESFL